MSQPAAGSQPSPILLFETLTAYQRTEAIKAALELDVFTAIGEGVDTPSALGARCRASERGMRILCDYLVVSGFLFKQDGKYRLTPDSAMFLDHRSPACIASIAGFLGHPLMTSKFDKLAESVRKGGTVHEKGTLAPEDPIWVEFARAMAPIQVMPAQKVAQLAVGSADPGRKLKVLDIAAGHGMFGIHVAKAHPAAEVVAVDWAPVLQVARENAARAGLDGRFQLRPGSAFEVDFGSGYDVVLLTNFLHHFDVATCENLLRRIHTAMQPGGRVITVEFIPNPDRVSPPQAAAFSLTMLAATPAGDAYTLEELQGMFHNTGFGRSELHSLAPMPHSALLTAR